MIKKRTSGESLIGIVVGIFILSIVILGIGKLLSYSNQLVSSHNDATNLRILKNNLSHIVVQLDTSEMLENEAFYIYKDIANSEFKVFTGATNSGYKYIDVDGNHVSDIAAYEKDIYARFLYIQREDTALNSQNQLIRASIRKLIKK